MKIWLCEKPSQGKDIAKALGVVQQGRNSIETRDGTVTWAVGHLFEESPPEDYGIEYKYWDMASLPIVPDPWKIKLKRYFKDGKEDKAGSARLKAQWEHIRDLLKKASSVVIATDPDAEGERIARTLMDQAGYSGPIQRLWSGSMLEESLQKAFRNLKPGVETEGYYFASLARSRADWLVGMNMTRAATLLNRTRFTPTNPADKAPVFRLGRVKTPTLWLIVNREREIENFVPKDYFELSGQLNQNGVDTTVRLKYGPQGEDRMFDQGVAEALASECAGKDKPLSVKTEGKRQTPARPFSLFDLQKYANQAWGWTADHTLTIAQALYETHKATTYPRTDCGYLPEEAKDELPRILEFLFDMPEEFPGAEKIVTDKQGPHLRKSVFDSSKVTAHHGIIPTLQPPNLSAMNADEKLAYLTIARRYLAAVSPDYEFERTVVSLEPKDGYVFTAAGNVPRYPGWKAHYGAGGSGEEDEDEDNNTFPPLDDGDIANLKPVETIKKTTKPPAYYTEATLLQDMKGIKKFVEDPELKKILGDEEGIGTEATRATIIKELKNGGYITLFAKKNLRPTPSGTDLIVLVETEFPRICDPGVTAKWEKTTAEMKKFGIREDVLINEVAAQIQKDIDRIKKDNPATMVSNNPHSGMEPTGRTTSDGTPILQNQGYWKAENILTMQKTICKAEITLETFATLIEKGKTDPLEFISPNTGNKFNASFVIEKGQAKFSFEERSTSPKTPTNTECPLSGKPLLEDEKYFYTEKFPKIRLAKEYMGRKMHPADYAAIMSSGKEGVVLEGFFSARTQKNYNAKVVFTPTAKWPVEMVFDKKPGSSGKPPAKKSARKK